MTIEQSEITHLRELLAKATPGPWRIGVSEREVCGDPEDGCWYSVAYTPNPRSPPKSARHRGWLDDASLIAAARNALPRLLDAYEAQAAEIERLRRVVNAADKGSPIYRAIERALDEHSAWIARPSPDVTRAIALAAGVAWMAAEPIDQNLEEIDAALADERARCAEQEAEIERLRSALGFGASRVRDEHLAPTTGG